MTGGRVTVLDEDRELAGIVPAGRREAAGMAAWAETVTVSAGEWNPLRDADLARGGFGLLMLGGMLVRRVGFDGRFGAEVLGPRDILRPWESDGDAGGTLPFDTRWRAIVPTRLAVLDAAWAGRMATYPQVCGELIGRALSRSRRLAASLAIVQLPRLDERLWLLFWELADRHGRVRPDGVHLDVPLTHELISHLAAARRPSVSGALARLAEGGLVRRSGRSWVLVGAPPAPRGVELAPAST